MNQQEFTETFVVPHEHKLMRAAVSICHNQEDAKDAVQQTFTNAWRASTRAAGDAQFRGDSKVYTWLFRILRNAILTPKRAKVGQMLEEVADFDEKAAQAPCEAHQLNELLTDERRGAMQKAIQRLPSAQREVVLLRYFEDLPVAAIAETLDLPLPTVKTRLFRARAALCDSSVLESVLPDGAKSRLPRAQTRKPKPLEI
ncbi:MAG: sigma-70 family RNA polymerase sigma factor [Pseudomonadota bacterium]|nr:sigma-70 family RNA polymerase sigma factor [Pseudomonadota bacterium]